MYENIFLTLVSNRQKYALRDMLQSGWLLITEYREFGEVDV